LYNIAVMLLYGYSYNPQPSGITKGSSVNHMLTIV